MTPKFSIILTSYNYGRYVGTTIESVLRQSLSDWELLIVDDGSTDNSWEVISLYSDPRIRATRFDGNRGACVAYNAAYLNAHGEFIASVDSDDVYHPDKLQRQKAFLDLHPDIGICGTYVEEIDADGNVVPPDTSTYVAWYNGLRDLDSPDTWIWQNHLCHSSVVLRKELHDRIGPFNSRLIYTPDWEYWIRSLVGGARFHVIPEPLVQYRSHGDNITVKGEPERLHEYADICREILHPYLAQAGRIDLILSNVIKFLIQPSIVQGSHQQATSLLDLLCLAPFRRVGSNAQDEDTGSEILVKLALCLFDTVRWHDQQRQKWEGAAGELASEVAALKIQLEEREAAMRAIPPEQMLRRAVRQLVTPDGSYRDAVYVQVRSLLRRGRSWGAKLSSR